MNPVVSRKGRAEPICTLSDRVFCEPLFSGPEFTGIRSCQAFRRVKWESIIPIPNGIVITPKPNLLFKSKTRRNRTFAGLPFRRNKVWRRVEIANSQPLKRSSRNTLSQNMEDTTGLVKNPESTYVIKFQDCDPLGHLNNVRYLDIFLNAREEHTMKYYALNLMELLRQHQTAWVVTNHHIAYLRPADHGRTVHILTRIIHFDNSTIILESLMLNENRSKLKSLLWTTFRYVSTVTGRPTDHSDDLMDLLEELDLEEMHYDPDGFQERIKYLSKQLKETE
jgi:acyl-CoA thioester hydrolase